jgi:hypothetical protein
MKDALNQVIVPGDLVALTRKNKYVLGVIQRLVPDDDFGLVVYTPYLHRTYEPINDDDDDPLSWRLYPRIGKITCTQAFVIKVSENVLDDIPIHTQHSWYLFPPNLHEILKPALLQCVNFIRTNLTDKDIALPKEFAKKALQIQP